MTQKSHQVAEELHSSKPFLVASLAYFPFLHLVILISFLVYCLEIQEG